ncbi:conserved hypothetical protein [Gammaproteobacteria bacterium]
MNRDFSDDDYAAAVEESLQPQLSAQSRPTSLVRENREFSDDDYAAAVVESLQPQSPKPVTPSLAQSARAGFVQAVGTNPDAYAEAQRVAKRVGVPVTTAVSMPSEINLQDRVRSVDFDTLAHMSPATAALFSDLEKAKVAHDDINNLSTIESKLRATGPKEGGVMDNLWHFAQSVARAPEGIARNIAAGFVPGFNARAWGVIEGAGALGSQYVERPLGVNEGNGAFGWLQAKAGEYRRLQEEMMREWTGDYASRGDIEKGIASGGQSLGMMAPGLLLAIATGNPKFAIGLGAAQQGSESVTKALDQGASAATALTLGIEDAGAEWATEMLPMGKFISDLKVGAPFLKLLGNQMVREVPSELAATAWQNFNEWANLHPEKNISQYLKELVPDEAQTVIATITQTFLTAGLGHTVNSFATRAEKAATAETNAPQLENIAKLSAASKTRQRDPETFEQFVKEGVKDRPVDTTFIDANTLFQLGIAEEVANISPSVAEQLTTARATGGLIAIPTEEYLTRIAPTEFSGPLLDHVKFDPDGYTRAESADFLKNHAEELQAEVEQVLKERPGAEIFRESQERVKQRILDELNTTNRFPQEVNHLYATLPAAYAATRAAKMGITPEQFFDRNPLRVVEKSLGGDEYGQKGHGPFGPSLTDYHHDAQGAISRLMEMKTGEAIGALHHPDIGDIDLVWGAEGTGASDGYGLAKLVKWHPEVISDLQGILSEMKVHSRSENRVQLESEKHKGGVRLQWDGESKHWLLTAYEKRGDVVTRTDTDHTQGEGDTARPTVASEDIVDKAIQEFYQGQAVLRGAYNPLANTIVLLQDADLSTFLHELGHYFFENDIQLAGELLLKERTETLSAGEQEILDDVHKLMNSHGISGGLDEQVMTWEHLSPEERRAHHEKTAESFERYLIEGKAPSIELHGVFQRFRGFLLNVYTSLKNFLKGHPAAGELSDEVRGVFDRMLATNEQIALAEKGRSMMPLFTDWIQAEKAGITLQEFADYHAQDANATNDAIQELQGRGLRDMQWSSNKRGRIIKQLQKKADQERRITRVEARREVMSQPVYQAWDKLDRGELIEGMETKKKSDPDVVDPSMDSLLTAMAKLGGLDRAEVEADGWIDPKEKSPMPLFGKPSLRKTGGLSVDAMSEALSQYGYLRLDEHGKWEVAELEDKVRDELAGTPRYSNAVDPDRLGSRLLKTGAKGRLDRGGLLDIGLSEEQIYELDKKGVTAADGIHPDLAAERLGFSSGDELARALIAAEPPKWAIEKLTDFNMLIRHGELATPEAIERAADQAIHTEVRARFVATEEAILAKAVGKRGVLLSAAREFAHKMISQLKVRDVRPSRYSSAGERAARVAVNAERNGDIATAAAEKRNQVINIQAARAAHSAREEIEATVKYLRGFAKPTIRKKLSNEYLDRIDRLLENVDLANRSLKQIDSDNSLRGWVEAKLSEGEDPSISEALLSKEDRARYHERLQAVNANGDPVYRDEEAALILLASFIDDSAQRSYKEMTVEELRGLRDTVKQMEHLARREKEVMTSQVRISYEEKKAQLCDELVANARESGKHVGTSATLIGSKKEKISAYGVSHIKVAIWAKIFGGGKENGVFWNTFIRSANERATFEASRRAATTEFLMKIINPLLDKLSISDIVGKGKYFPEIKGSLNWKQRFSTLLNCGNEKNLQRLMGGGIAGVVPKLEISQIRAILKTFTREEVLAAQAIWDHFESFRPEMAAKELRVNGVEPEWVAATPFTLETVDGHTVELRGGYFPIVFDSKASVAAQQHEDARSGKELMQAAYSKTTTNRGHFKGRVEEVHDRPLLLTMQALYSGFDNVIHDLAWHEWVIDFNKLMSGPVRDAILDHYGVNVYHEITSWRDNIIVGPQKINGIMEYAASFLRKNISPAALAFNTISAPLQLVGIMQSGSIVGWKWVGTGILEYLRNPLEKTRQVNGLSGFMASRTRTMFRDLNELRNRVEGKTLMREKFERYEYSLISFFQQIVDVITWLGAYQKALGGEHDLDTARALADQAVKDSQGGGEVVDQAGVVRGSQVNRLFTVFYDFMNTQANVLYLKGATAQNRADMFMNFALVGVLAPVLGAVLRDALVPGDSGNWDDMEKAIKKLGLEVGSNFIGMFLLAREFNEVLKAFYGESLGYQGPAGLRPVADLVNLGKQAVQGDLDLPFFKALDKVLGDFARIPAVQINRTLTGIDALREGKTDNPAALVFGFQHK